MWSVLALTDSRGHRFSRLASDHANQLASQTYMQVFLSYKITEHLFCSTGTDGFHPMLR